MREDSNKDLNEFMARHFTQEDIRVQLLEILGSMMRTDISSLDHIRSNAKTLGGMLGAQEQFMDDQKHLGAEFWVDRNVLDIQDLTYQQIERTPLGRAMKNQLQKLEDKTQAL